MAKRYTFDKPEKILVNAEAFYISALLIANEATRIHKEYPAHSFSLLNAANTNHALAFELYIKCLSCIKTGSHVGGHNLFTLFNSLDDESRSEIIKHYDESYDRDPMMKVYKAEILRLGEEPKEDLLSCLEEAGDTFVNNRYIHENTPTGYRINHGIIAIRRAISKLLPTFPFKLPL